MFIMLFRIRTNVLLSVALVKMSATMLSVVTIEGDKINSWSKFQPTRAATAWLTLG